MCNELTPDTVIHWAFAIAFSAAMLVGAGSFIMIFVNTVRGKGAGAVEKDPNRPAYCDY